MRFILKWMGLVMKTWPEKMRIDMKLTQIICWDALHRGCRSRHRKKNASQTDATGSVKAVRGVARPVDTWILIVYRT